MDAYDRLPYESLTFPETHPETLALLGRLFGLATADPARCRVLELGCASGGNLIPMAWALPESRFVGIDRSARQIDDGAGLIGTLGLANIELRAADILSLNGDEGPFDYVVAHGVLSWVPEPVRDHLLRVARRLLAPAGLLYVSFNTLPGWRMRGMLRDILLFACRGLDAPDAKLAAAYAALDRLERALHGLDALSARYLRREIAYLREQTHPSYLLYEYLAEHNRPLLFTEFLAQSRGHGLRYLCDSDLSTLFPATLGDRVEQALADIDDDMELEQWLDFVTNRNFRRSLLCRDDAAPADELDLDRFTESAFAADLQPARRPDLKRARTTPYRLADATPLEVSHPLTKAALGLLAARFPDALGVAELARHAQHAVAAAGGPAHDSEAFTAELFSLFAHGALRPSVRPRVYPRGGARPRADALARAQAASGRMRVAAAHHTSLDLDEVAAFLLARLDGSRSAAELTGLALAALRDGTLAPPDGVRLDAADPRLEQRVGDAVASLLRLFAHHGLLEADG